MPVVVLDSERHLRRNLAGVLVARAARLNEDRPAVGRAGSSATCHVAAACRHHD